MKKLALKKLTVTRETLRQLEETRLGQIEGGKGGSNVTELYSCQDSVNVCCA